MERESSLREDKHTHHRDGSDRWDKKDKKSFTWGFSEKVRDREKERERGPPRDKERVEDSGLELTRMIGVFDFRIISFHCGGGVGGRSTLDYVIKCTSPHGKFLLLTVCS